MQGKNLCILPTALVRKNSVEQEDCARALHNYQINRKRYA